MRRSPAPIALLLTLTISGVGACSTTGGASPSVAGSPAAASPAATAAAASPNAAPTVSPRPSIALGPAVRLRLDSSGPIIASDAGPAGRHWVLPAAAARDRNGGFVLFIVWFGDTAGDQVVTVARSDDGRTWRTEKDAVMTDLGMDVVNPGPIPAAARQEGDGSWVLYGWAIHESRPGKLTTWRATAPQPEGPWTLDGPAVIDTGAAGSWDAQMASVGAVQRVGDGYGLWYEGQGIGNSVRGDIGFATSADGRTWQKSELPAIPRGHCGDATARAMQQPRVEAWSGGFVAAVATVGQGEEDLSVIGLTSADGASWVCASATPMLRAEDIPGSAGIHTIASVPLDGDRFLLIIESLVDDRSELWSASVEVGG